MIFFIIEIRREPSEKTQCPVAANAVGNAAPLTIGPYGSYPLNRSNDSEILSPAWGH